MVGTSTSWKAISNSVGDRMIDGSLSHMFTTRRRIRRRTQILNRELRQLSSVHSYDKYVKVKKAVLRFAPGDDDTDEDYFSNTDFDDTRKFAETNSHGKNYDDEKICDVCSDSDEMEVCESENGKEVLEKSANELVENESDTDEEVENVEQCLQPHPGPSSTREDVKRNLDEDFDSLSNSYNTDNTTVPGDSGIDDDSRDSMVINSNDVTKEKQIIEKSVDELLTSPTKPQPKITCTEIVTSKYRILRDNLSERTDRRTNEQLLNNSEDREHDNCLDEMLLSHDETSEQKECTRTYTPITIPTEIDSLKYVLSNLRIHNRYGRDYYSKDYCNDTIPENGPDDNHTELVGSSRPMDLDDLIENDDLIEIDTGSTLTLEDISEDDEIFLIEIPKSIIDNQDLTGKRMRIKKKSVLIDDTKYEAYCKQNDELSCILKKKENANYKIGTIRPRASIVIRQKPPDKESHSLEFHPSDDKKQYTPFPKNLKRRNPLVLQSECNDSYSNKEDDIVMNQISSPKRKVGKSI